ncbi:MAG: type III-A CRISPR-associated RAMP protein Csm3 [Methanobacteriota archaeon]|nr:MAG: type III-A CRISPR-associated RAMP protein Csm3 [Euryarchaeota archaeon]
MTKKIKLLAQVFITFDIQVLTGLHIGGSDAGIEIGGVDNTVIRDRLTDQPYIPGSSLKGKMRSLLDKYEGKSINFPPRTPAFHVCQDEDEYVKCDVCQVFGVSGQQAFAKPTRLLVRDVFLSTESVERLKKAQTDMPFTEIKTEVSIDRITSAANPRPFERVPAGTEFSDAEFVYAIYYPEDIQRIEQVFKGMKLVEDDYLGGGGSRGSGKVMFKNIKIHIRPTLDAGKPLSERKPIGEYPTLKDLRVDELKMEIQAALA